VFEAIGRSKNACGVVGRPSGIHEHHMVEAGRAAWEIAVLAVLARAAEVVRLQVPLCLEMEDVFFLELPYLYTTT